MEKTIGKSPFEDIAKTAQILISHSEKRKTTKINLYKYPEAELGSRPDGAEVEQPAINKITKQ